MMSAPDHPDSPPPGPSGATSPTGPNDGAVDGSTAESDEGPIWRNPDEGEHEFNLAQVFGGWSGLLDVGLPSVAFITTFALTGRDLRSALIAAIAVGVVMVIVRLARKSSLQNAIGGFIVLAISAFIAHRTGRAEDFYLPGLLINAGYALGYIIANLARFPIIGLVVGLAAGWGMSWRKDPILLRAFTRAGWLWAAGFLLRLVVQGPLYLAGQVEVLGVARIAMGWPMFAVILWLTYLVIKGSVPAEKWKSLRMSVAHLPGNRGGAA